MLKTFVKLNFALGHADYQSNWRGMAKKIQQIVQTAAETMKTLYC